jgi:hypothetical protein
MTRLRQGFGEVSPTFAPIGCCRERQRIDGLSRREGSILLAASSAAAWARATEVAAELAQSQLITTVARALSHP